MFSGAFIAVIAAIAAFVVGILIGCESQKVENINLVTKVRELSEDNLHLTRRLSSLTNVIQMHRLLDGE